MGDADGEPEIKFADATAMEALAPYADEVLAVLADVLKSPGMKDAFVSDQSTIGDFMPLVETGEVRQHPDPFNPGKTRPLFMTAPSPEEPALLAEISRRLGVPVAVKDCVYEVAIRVRDR
jgi:hypothetical protein